MTREEAIKIVKSNWPEGRHQIKEALETLIPELAESEDERIRKAIWLVLVATEEDQDVFYRTHNITRKECTDWLEKQKEQEPAALRDSRQIALMIENGRRSGVIEGRKQVVNNPEEYGLCKPAEWSEEDENMLNKCISRMTDIIPVTGKSGGIKDMTFETRTEMECVKWLNELPSRFKSLPKVAISEEALREGIGHYGITQYQIDKWLKKYITIV